MIVVLATSLVCWGRLNIAPPVPLFCPQKTQFGAKRSAELCKHKCARIEEDDGAFYVRFQTGSRSAVSPMRIEKHAF